MLREVRAVECIAAVGSFLANISYHSIWEIWDTSSTISNQVRFAIYVHAVEAVLPLRQLMNIAGMSIYIGVLVGLGLGRVWVPRRWAVAVFVAGGLVSVGGFMALSALKSLDATSPTLCAVMILYSVGMPFILGRLISRFVRRDGASG
jgi:hypothetical protein